ncbi:MAG: hypothetical protein WC781_03165 [Candidatus Pacearchaeota archaeon]|jgi:hypothetical protein
MVERDLFMQELIRIVLILESIIMGFFVIIGILWIGVWAIFSPPYGQSHSFSDLIPVILFSAIVFASGLFGFKVISQINKSFNKAIKKIMTFLIIITIEFIILSFTILIDMIGFLPYLAIKIFLGTFCLINLILIIYLFPLRKDSENFNLSRIKNSLTNIKKR